MDFDYLDYLGYFFYVGLPFIVSSGLPLLLGGWYIYRTRRQTNKLKKTAGLQ